MGQDRFLGEENIFIVSAARIGYAQPLSSSSKLQGHWLQPEYLLYRVCDYFSWSLSE